MSGYLDRVDTPGQVKKLNLAQLQDLAEEIRQELITVLARNGGHLGPNLGVVELTIALHRVFNTPKDKFVWDVSHQSYVHKLLTGRRERFHTIRSTGGISGFALRSESEHDCYGAAHAGTALSAALGICAARDRLGSDENVVAIFGDAALTNGISFEALNNLAYTTKRFIGVLNDNEFSIARNVGAIASYLNKLITHPSYNKLARDFERFIRRLPKGEVALRLAHKAEEGFKGALTDVGLQPSAKRGGVGWARGLREQPDFRGDGAALPGPDRRRMTCRCSSARWSLPRPAIIPIVIHVLTRKGKGFDAALKNPEKFHGLGPYDVRYRRDPARQAGRAAELAGCLWAGHGQPLQARQFHRGHYGRDAQRDRAQDSGEGDARPLLRRGHRGGARGPVRLRHGHHGLSPGMRHLLDLPPARL